MPQASHHHDHHHHLNLQPLDLLIDEDSFMLDIVVTYNEESWPSMDTVLEVTTMSTSPVLSTSDLSCVIISVHSLDASHDPFSDLASDSSSVAPLGCLFSFLRWLIRDVIVPCLRRDRTDHIEI
ncbi:hypothetical protein BGX23_008441 [Mortierella sp. AD031]|nr:hypothetical protein BGX23_008441 [Mortierella sp. AD031]